MSFWKSHVERSLLLVHVWQLIRKLRDVSFLMLFISISSVAQSSIKGKISDGNTNLPHVNVILFTSDSAVVMVVATDTVGEFSMRDVLPGEYLIAAFMIGYEKLFLPQLSVRESNIFLPPIVLHESATELSEVVVSEDRSLFDHKTDRLVINMEQNITSSGNTILEVPVASLNFGIQKNLHKRGILRLSIDDILYTNKWRYKTYLPEDNLDVDFRYDGHNQFLRITYTRNLGNAKVKVVGSRSGSEDERKRLSQ